MPWCGYFYKYLLSDVFVVMDTVQYSKGTVINRVKVRGAAGPMWLTVPVVTGGRAGQPISAVELEPGADWKRVHLNTLRTYYGRTPFFSRYFPVIEEIYGAGITTLLELNDRLFVAALGCLGLTPAKVVKLSTLEAGGRASDLVLNIVKAVGGECYLSGTGARSYNDAAAFAANGIRLTYMEFAHPIYQQGRHDDFVPGLSVIDLLFNHGPDAVDIMRRDNIAFEERVRGSDV